MSPRHHAPRLLLAALLAGSSAAAQDPAAAPVRPPAPAETPVPSGEDVRVREIAGAPSPQRVEADIRRLAGFGTRHTLSDTVSRTRGIGAARRWLFEEMTRISAACGGCLEVRYVDSIIPGRAESRIPRDTRVVNVVATQRGQTDANRYVLIMGHYDSRVNGANDSTSDAPGANDDASGVAAVLEAARVLSRYRFDGSVVYAALAGEEQGLNGGEILAQHARQNGWRIEGVLNNDIIGNTRGQNGVVDNTTVRVFGPGIAPTATQAELRRILTTGGELDGPSRQLARYVDRIADRYATNLDARVIYRLDRFGRGGDHTPFFNLGFPAVRLTETWEDYTRQHQDLRVENGIRYGDVPDMVDFAYVAKVTGLNAASLASLAWAPPSPDSVTIAGGVSPSTRLRWRAVSAPDLAGYRVYWREPTAPQWQWSRWVGNVTDVTLENIVIDNFFFAVAAVDREGHESVPVFPLPGR
ncbi:MAG TPA: M28 family metallopeptidase [Longimicrobiaceae bacterium]|nr:M28 family metallopeptidase [Longimicrobiaceae bacterium]